MATIIPHRHCIVCGKAIEADKSFCSDECKSAWEKERKKQRNFSILLFILILGLLFLIFFSPR